MAPGGAHWRLALCLAQGPARARVWLLGRRFLSHLAQAPGGYSQCEAAATASSRQLVPPLRPPRPPACPLACPPTSLPAFADPGGRQRQRLPAGAHRLAGLSDRDLRQAATAVQEAGGCAGVWGCVWCMGFGPLLRSSWVQAGVWTPARAVTAARTLAAAAEAVLAVQAVLLCAAAARRDSQTACPRAPVPCRYQHTFYVDNAGFHQLLQQATFAPVLRRREGFEMMGNELLLPTVCCVVRGPEPSCDGCAEELGLGTQLAGWRLCDAIRCGPCCRCRRGGALQRHQADRLRRDAGDQALQVGWAGQLPLLARACGHAAPGVSCGRQPTAPAGGCCRAHGRRASSTAAAGRAGRALRVLVHRHPGPHPRRSPAPAPCAGGTASMHWSSGRATTWPMWRAS